MTFFAPRLQIVSDLHLETPIANPQYSHMNLRVTGTSLFLLGDIGLVRHGGLFLFLRGLLNHNRSCRIFYVLGNHEAYQTTLEHAVERMRMFEETAGREYGGRFHLLFRDRYDLNEKVTILGCTLWSSIRPDQAAMVGSKMTDYNKERGIQNWTPERSCSEHARDLEWLNEQVNRIQTTEPHRSIVIATHHCPTTDPRATDPKHESSAMHSGFVSDLSRQSCWTSPAVKVWAFGHTHYSCAFRDDAMDRVVVSNQKTYSSIASGGGKGKRVKTVVVEQRGNRWQVVEDVQGFEKSEEEEMGQ
jgi:predicted phosphodiesterase